MTTSKTKSAAKAATNLKDEVQVQNPFDAAVKVPTENSGAFDWDNLVEQGGNDETQEDIIRKCLADKKGYFKLVTGLHVKNVKAFVGLSKSSNRVRTRLTFVIKEKVFGMVKDENNLDAFGDPTVKMGQSEFVMCSTFAVSGAMKETAKGAIFADEVSNMTAIVTDPTREVEITGRANVANVLYAGGIIDVLCQYVPKDTEYRNPFSRKRKDDEPTTFDEDRVIHHIVRLQFGEVGNDYYRSQFLL